MSKQLKIESSCEIDDLIDVVTEKTGRKRNEVEKAFFKLYIYPTTTKTFLTVQFGPIIKEEEFAWLNDALSAIFAEAGVTKLYVTAAI